MKQLKETKQNTHRDTPTHTHGRLDTSDERIRELRDRRKYPGMSH